MSEFLFQDILEIREIDTENCNFEKVSRIVGQTETNDVAIDLDVNTQIYPIGEHDRLNLCLSATLQRDGKKETGYFDQSNTDTLANDFEYVMSGKAYEIKKQGKKNVVVNISFGGLLLRAVGEAVRQMKYSQQPSCFLAF